MQRALIYCRVSTEEQVDQGHSLETQESVCRKLASQQGLRVENIYRDEGKSATTLNRPALQEMLAFCQQEKGINAVIVQETDRLARNTHDHLTIRAILKKAGVKLLSVGQPLLDDSPEGKMLDTILASVNQFQSDLNSRKTKRGMQEKFNRGVWPTYAPLGYLNCSESIGEENLRKFIVKDPVRWPLMQKAFHLYLTGNHSVEEINDILYAKGLRSRNNKKLAHSILVDALQNPFYAGTMRWGGQEKKGSHEPMITPQEYKRVFQIFDTHNFHACRRRKHSFLLRGFVYCNICNQRYTSEKHPQKKKDYYHCTNRSLHSNKGQNIEAWQLEKLVEEKFKTLQFSPDFIQHILQKLTKVFTEQKNVLQQEKQILYNQQKAIEVKRDKAEEKLLSGILSDTDFMRLKIKYHQELSSIQNRVEELDAQREVDTTAVQQVVKLCRSIYEGYCTAPYELKRHYLGLFWEKFLVQDKKIIQAIPTKIIQVLQEENLVIIKGKLWPSPKGILTLLQDVKYVSLLKEKLKAIQELQSVSGMSQKME